MKTIAVAFALASSALLSSGANAAPITVNPSMAPDNGVENVRLVCDEFGRCYRRGGPRVVVQEGYGYAPRDRYYDRRGYYDNGYGYYDTGPGVGISVSPGGVGVGVGVGPRW